jgi:hypothetical protein
VTPNPKSPVSIGLIANLLQLGSKDSNQLVASTCEQLLSTLERVINPPAPTLQFPPISLPYPTASEALVNGDIQENGIDSDMEDYVQAIPAGLFHTDSFCQTEDSELEGRDDELLSRSVLDVSLIKETVSQIFREELGSFINLQNGRQNLSPLPNQYSNENDDMNDNSSHNSDNNFFRDSIDDVDDAPRHSKRPRRSPTANESHIVLAEEVHKNLPLDKVAALTNSLHNGFSSSNEVEDNVSVSVEEMLLTFDDEVVATSEAF